MLLLLKRFVGARPLDVTDIPLYMNELDSLEDLYFGVKRAKDEREQLRLRGLYAYCFAMKAPQRPNVHVPYNLLTFLVKMAPKGSEEEFVREKLEAYGYPAKGQVLNEDLKRRILYASNWIKDFEEIKETAVCLSKEEKSAVEELIEFLDAEDNPEKIQNAIFNFAKEHDVQPADFFKLLYTILIGVPQGPRLGPYLLAMGKKNVVDALRRTIGKG
jgi:lysyl-tRNA synthetase class 1